MVPGRWVARSELIARAVDRSTHLNEKDALAMNVAQLHLILNHFPIVGFIASFGLLLYTLWRPSREVRTVALAGMVISGLLVLPVLITGNASEEMVEHLPGVSEGLIGRHENAADIASAVALIAGGLALMTLILQRWAPRFVKEGLAATMVVGLVAIVTIGWTAHLGGAIRHPEIALAWNAGGEQGGEGGERSEGGELRGGGMGGTSLLPGLGGRSESREGHDRDDD